MTELEELYQFFYLTPVGLAKILSDGTVQQINPVMVSTLMTIDKTYNIHNNLFQALSYSDNDSLNNLKSFINDPKKRNIDNIVMTINSEHITKIRVKCTKISPTLLIVVIENITEFAKIEYEKELMESELDDQKERLAKIGQVIRTVIHDLRNPLANIKTISDMVELASVEEAKDLLTENITTILDEINGIINDMLDYTRAEIPKIKPIEIADINRQLEMKFELMSKQCGIPIIYNSPNSFIINCDETKILRIFSNIVGNAIKALISHDIKNPEIHVSIVKDNNKAIITISDNGDGIPENLIDKLFEPFAFKSGYVGNGIGLPIVKNIIDMHEGSIKVTSSSNGTIFNITIPI